MGAAWGGIELFGFDGVALLRKLGCDQIININGMSPFWVNMFLAMTIADAVEFVRLPLVIATTPRLSRALKRFR